MRWRGRAPAWKNAAVVLLNLVMATGERAVAEVLAMGGTEEAVRELVEDGATFFTGNAGMLVTSRKSTTPSACMSPPRNRSMSHQSPCASVQPRACSRQGR